MVDSGDQALTRQALSQGQLPRQARQRLQNQRGFFTSDLTVNEYLVTEAAGYQPLGLVMGTCFYRVSFWGFFRGYQTYTGELTAVTAAQLAARELALHRMQQEAVLLGAHGVVGVRLQLRAYEWSSQTVEFTAVGTAIRIPGRDPEPVPFTSDLSGQEFWQLHQAGYYPRGVALGLCSYYIHTDWGTAALTRGGLLGQGSSQNQEVRQYTHGFNEARHLACTRLRQDIRKHGGDGVVGMNLKIEVEEIEYELNDTHYQDLLVHIVALGTVIAQDQLQPQPPSPLMIYDLASRQSRGLSIE